MEWIILYTQVDNSILSLYIFPCTGIQKRTKFATWNKKNYLILKIIEWHEKKYKLVTVMYAYIGYYTDCNGTAQLQLFQTPTGEARTRSNRYPWEPFGSCRLLEIFIFRPDTGTARNWMTNPLSPVRCFATRTEVRQRQFMKYALW